MINLLPLPPTSLDPQVRWYLDKLVSALSLGQNLAQQTSAVPSGCMMLWPASVVPDGWLLCDWQLLNSVEFPALYAVLGTQWNSTGDPAGWFRLPKAQDKFLKIASTALGVGLLSGSSEIALTRENLPALTLEVEIPPHDHVFTGDSHTHTITDAGHTHDTTESTHLHTSLVVAGTVQSGAGADGVTAGNTGSALTNLTVDTATTGVLVDDASVSGTVQPAALLGTTELGAGIPLVVDPEHMTVNLIIKM